MATKPPRHTNTASQVEEIIGPNGEKLCRWCKKEVQPPKRTFCGDPVCLHEWKIRSDGGYAREQVLKRDRGVCGSCGLDTEKLKALIMQVRLKKGEQAYELLLDYYKAQFKFNFSLETHYWEADHIKPVAEGGGSCGLDNLQTLCRVCHRLKTIRQMRRAHKTRSVNKLSKWQRRRELGAYADFHQSVSEDSDD